MRRTHLPLNALRVLDAAARHLSFTKAADELAVTPAAVGQQIRALEELLGVILFRRLPKGLELTGEGAAGLDALRRGFLEFEEAVRAMQSGQGSNILTIAAPRDLAGKWLAARLSRHVDANPELEIRLLLSEGDTDFTESNIDVAIWLATGPGTLEGAAIDPVGLVTVTAPHDAADRMLAWHDGAAAVDKAMILPDAGLAIDAAASGLGQATVPLLLAEADLAAGRVKVVAKVGDPRQYWLVAPLPQWRQKKVKALVEALTAPTAA